VDFQSQSQTFNDIMESEAYILEQCNVYQKYKVDKMMYGWGLSVSRNHRGRGIAKEMLRTRIPLCQALNIQLTSTIFSNQISQRCAESIGFQNDYTISFEDLVKINNRWDFRKTQTTATKLMSLFVE
jgi:RimJ/RimL family protein N-acetyltransferase